MLSVAHKSTWDSIVCTLNGIHNSKSLTHSLARSPFICLPLSHSLALCVLSVVCFIIHMHFMFSHTPIHCYSWLDFCFNSTTICYHRTTSIWNEIDHFAVHVSEANASVWLGELTYFIYIKNIWNNLRVHRPSKPSWTNTLVVIGRQKSGNSSRSNDNNNSDNKRKSSTIEDVLKFKLSPSDYLYVFSPKSVQTKSIGRVEKWKREWDGQRASLSQLHVVSFQSMPSKKRAKCEKENEHNQLTAHRIGIANTNYKCACLRLLFY